MNPQELLEKARDSMNVQKAFGDPYERDGVTILPVAKVGGGGGGGGDSQNNGGAGFGLMVRPVGVYQIKDGNVKWQPAIDINKMIVGWQIVSLFGFLALRQLFKSKRRRGRIRSK